MQKSAIILFGALLFLFGCNETSTPSKPYDESRELVPNPEGNTPDSVLSENKINTSNDPCGFDKYYQSPQTPKLAKAIYGDKDWNLSNDTEALALLDSLSAKSISSRSFYFKVVTKSKSKSDGYYSEGLGSWGVSYIEKNTIEFLNNFENSECFTDKDLETWANIVMLEFGIEYEKVYDDSPVRNYFKLLNKNCINCSASQKKTLDKFSKLVTKRWREYVKAQKAEDAGE